LNGRVIRVDLWEEFKNLLIKYDVKELVYRIEMSVPAKYLTSLRLILPTSSVQYVFIDTASGDKLRKTGIAIHRDKLGNMYIRDEDVINFIRSELNKKDLKIRSYWSM
jgi:hypothetical protein